MKRSLFVACVTGGILCACGSRTGVDAFDTLSAPTSTQPTPANPNRHNEVVIDAGHSAPPEMTPAIADAGEEHACAPLAMYSEASPSADVFGAIVRYGGGADLPRGHYRVEYVDGCVKYSGNQDWSIHAYADGSAAWWLVGQGTSDRIAMLPGTVGFLASAGGFASFDACVAANHKVAPLNLDFRGGKLGVWLRDEPYGDNLGGQSGRSPQWRIVFLDGCSI